MTSYPLAADTFGPDEIAAAKEVLDSGRLTMGERVASFEREFAAYVGAAHAVMVNSGSSANLLMVDASLNDERHAMRRGDEVLVPALAWPTTVWPLVQLGLIPVLVDVDPKTLALDLTSAETALSRRTRGLFLTHVLGQAADSGMYASFCARHGLVLLEDACESLGAHSSDGRHVGNGGAMASFSFYYSHHISTVEGGMVVTSDDARADHLRSLRAHGWIRERRDRAALAREHAEIDPRFMFVMPGYNVRPMEIQGAVGLVQLRKLETMLQGRERLARAVERMAIEHAPWLELLGADHLRRNVVPRAHSWMTLPFRIRPDAPLALTEVKARLHDSGVDTRPIIAGNLARHPVIKRFEHRRASSLTVADALFDRGLMIGCHPVSEKEATETLETAFQRLRAR